jgi:hypothetical protein
MSKIERGNAVPGVLYDYLIGVTIMGVIFISAVFVVPQMSYVNLLYLDQQQLRNIADQTLKAIVLETGYPANWGASEPFDPESVERFGLAESESSSFYVLDPDKVQRLVQDYPLGYINYTTIRELLDLEDYGFSISIVPPFNVTIENEEFEFDEDEADIELKVNVSARNGMPIPNAVVESTIIYSTKDGVTARLYFLVDTTLTDSMGTCEVEKHIDAPSGEEFSDILVVFRITVADVSSLVVTYQSIPSNDIANITIAGDDVILTSDQIPTPRGTRWVDNIILFDWNNFIFLYNGTRDPQNDMITYGQGFKVWNRTFPGLKKNNPAFLLFSFWVPLGQGQGRRTVLIAGPDPNWMGSRVINYGGMPTSSGSSVKIQRNVVISRMVYTLELTMWKESS